jgi:hypothetical protein
MSKHIYIIINIILFAFFMFWGSNTISAQKIKNGVLDLRNKSLETPIVLDGEWEFYHHELLTTDELNQKKDKNYEKFPVLWKKLKDKNGKYLSSFGYLSLENLSVQRLTSCRF